MTIISWIVNVLLAAAFAAAGGIKMTRPAPALIDMGMEWVADTSHDMVRAIGAIELVGAIGLILPKATGVGETLTPIAAVGLAAVMLAAVVVHLKRDESVVPPMVLGGIAVLSAILGFATL